MPIYEYRCGGCDHRFEALVQGGRAPTCPACGGAELDKQLSVFAVNARGSQPPPMPAGGCGGCQHAGPGGGCMRDPG